MWTSSGYISHVAGEGLLTQYLYLVGPKYVSLT